MLGSLADVLFENVGSLGCCVFSEKKRLSMLILFLEERRYKER